MLSRKQNLWNISKTNAMFVADNNIISAKYFHDSKTLMQLALLRKKRYDIFAKIFATWTKPLTFFADKENDDIFSWIK